MNRLSPLIARQPRTPARSFAQWQTPVSEAPVPMVSDDLRLFLTGWIGGLVFFGTLLL